MWVRVKAWARALPERHWPRALRSGRRHPAAPSAGTWARPRRSAARRRARRPPARAGIASRSVCAWLGLAPSAAHAALVHAARAGLVSRSERACCTFRACPLFLSHLLTCLLAQADLLAHGAVPLDSGLRRRELLACGIAPRSKKMWLSLRSAGAQGAYFSASPGRPNFRPASADQPSGWLWPAIQALVST